MTGTTPTAISRGTPQLWAITLAAVATRVRVSNPSDAPGMLIEAGGSRRRIRSESPAESSPEGLATCTGRCGIPDRSRGPSTPGVTGATASVRHGPVA